MFHDDGSFEYTAAAGFSGVETFTYEVDDGSVTGNLATVQISVSSTPNGPPIAVDDEFDVGVDPVIGNVLPNDIDPDDDPLEALLVSGPSDGELLLNADGSFTYTPTMSEDASDDAFTYQVTDGLQTSNVAVVLLKKRRVNLTAYRPNIIPPDLVLFGINLGADARVGVFPTTAIPDADEVSPGVGIRINGDDDDGDGKVDRDPTDTTVSKEDDLIKVHLAFDNKAAKDKLVLKRSGTTIQVWGTANKSNPVFGAGLTRELGITGAVDVWVEWTSGDHGSADLTFEIQNAAGMVLHSDTIKLKT